MHYQCLFSGFIIIWCFAASAQIGTANIAEVELASPVIANHYRTGLSQLPRCSPTVGLCMTGYQVVYRFNGNGKWNNPANWISNVVPPRVLPAGSHIIVDPAHGGECILNVQQTIGIGAVLTLMTTKKLKVREGLLIEE